MITRPMSYIRELAATGPDRHWFEAATMRFFGSRVGRRAYISRDGEHAYFVSSEQDQGPRLRAWDGERHYSIRRITLTTGAMATVNPNGNDGFGYYPDHGRADRAARRMASQ